MKFVLSVAALLLVASIKMTDSPAYRLNHEEVVKALEEGINFAEGLDPKEIVADHQDHVVAMHLDGPNGRVEMPARTVWSHLQRGIALLREKASVALERGAHVSRG